MGKAKAASFMCSQMSNSKFSPVKSSSVYLHQTVMSIDSQSSRSFRYLSVKLLIQLDLFKYFLETVLPAL